MLAITVAVTSANSLVGRMLLQHLRKTNARVMALVRSPVELPSEQTVSNWMSSPRAMQAMQDADVIVHLSGEVSARKASDYYAANVQTTQVVAQALRSGRAKRVLFISFPGADASSSNHFLRTKGQAEQLLIDSGKEAVIFRVSAIINTPSDPGPLEQALQAPAKGKVKALGDGQQRARPIYRGDVVAALLAAMEHGSPCVYNLGGPDEMTLNDLIRLLNCNPNVGISHTSAWLARTLSLFVPDLPRTFVDVMLRDSTGDPSQAVKEFGLRLTSLGKLWMTSK